MDFSVAPLDSMHLYIMYILGRWWGDGGQGDRSVVWLYNCLSINQYVHFLVQLPGQRQSPKPIQYPDGYLTVQHSI